MNNNNYVSLVGNLGSDPKEINHNDMIFYVLSLAQTFTTQNGDKTNWFDVAVFGESIKMVTHLKKGDFIRVEGSISTVKKTIESKIITQIKISAKSISKIIKINKADFAQDVPDFADGVEVPF
jgi:single-stranded DNA-binding protein